MYGKTLTNYICYFGTPNQKERLAAGIALPDAEVDEVVYRAVWVAFRGWYKRQRLTEEEVRQVAVMHRMAQPGDPVTFELVEPADELTAKQWDALKLVRIISRAFHARVTPFWVIGCCGRKRWKKVYARVEFVLEERAYKVEISLEEQPYQVGLALGQGRIPAMSERDQRILGWDLSERAGVVE